ncbi:MAG: hypothetical protein EXS14_03110 [Planctomycetes bacterium]|nr:hypothetical protein [Planctomycetota bacterium]
MSLHDYINALGQAEISDLWRHWNGGTEPARMAHDALRREVVRLMSDVGRVRQRVRELPPRCREFLFWLVRQPQHELPLSRFESDGLDCPLSLTEIESARATLRRRGFVLEIRDLDWKHFQEPMLKVPEDLASLIQGHTNSVGSGLEAVFTLRGFLKTVPRKELESRLAHLGLPEALAADPAALLERISDGDTVARLFSAITDPEIREVAELVLRDHGGLGELRHLERTGVRCPDTEKVRVELERCLLGTVMRGDLTDIGIQFSAGSVILFLDVIRPTLVVRATNGGEDVPAVAPDILADISAAKTYIDHHAVRTTRDGTLYRATLRKMEEESLSPGERPFGSEASLAFILRFLEEEGLIRPDAESRMRTSEAWEAFAHRGPIERTEMLLSFVSNDNAKVRTPAHMASLRKALVAQLQDLGRCPAIALKPLALLARNAWLAGMDRASAAERFQRRFKRTPVTTLPTPAVLARDLVEFSGEGMWNAGIVELRCDDFGPEALRLTRVGAAVLGLPVEESDAGAGALLVTPDFEVIVYPELSGVDLLHELARFARREKADFILHYRISERSVHEAAAAGMRSEEMLSVLSNNARHAVPINVEQSMRGWAEAVTVLQVRRGVLVSAASEDCVDRALRVRELRGVVLDRLNPTTLLLGEDPASPRISEALRSAGFFLRG